MARRRKRRVIRESAVVEAIRMALELRGWLCIRQHVGDFIPLAEKDKPDPRVVKIGEKGTPDWLSIRVKDDVAEILYWEAKRPREKPRKHQRLALDLLEARGFTATYFDSFRERDGGRAPFLEWYAERHPEEMIRDERTGDLK